VEYVPGTSMIDTDGPLYLYAQWIYDYVTIRYVTNDGSMGWPVPGSEEVHKTLEVPQGSTASTQPGYLFVNWTDSQGRVVSTSHTFVPDRVNGQNMAATYVANYKEMDPVAIYYKAGQGGSVYPTISRVNAVFGDPIRSTATPAPGYVFVNWTDEKGNVVGSGVTYRPRRVDGQLWQDGTTFYANFAPAGGGAMSIPVTKVWDVPGTQSNLPRVTITLHRDGAPFRTLQLSGGNWTGSFDNIPRAASNGRAYAYTVTENAIPGFTLTHVTGSAEVGFTLTNTTNDLIVRFVDWDGKILKRQTVPYGGNATPPDDPTRARYEFEEWVGNYTYVTSDRYVYARYTRTPNWLYTPILDAAVPLAGGSVSNFGESAE